MMNSTRITLMIALGVLMIDSIIELSFITSMVSWLHSRAGKSFEVNYQDSSFSLHGKPANLSVNQGHTSNGAAGTAFVLIGMGGFLTLFLRGYAARSSSAAGIRKFSTFWNYFWLVMTLLSALLTLSALIYTFVATDLTSGQFIDASLASTLNNHPYPNYVAYPVNSWTPETWFDAVLQLPLTNTADVVDIHAHLEVMRGWKWNLIPMFAIGLFTCIIAFMDAMEWRKESQFHRNMDTKMMDG